MRNSYNYFSSQLQMKFKNVQQRPNKTVYKQENKKKGSGKRM